MYCDISDIGNLVEERHVIALSNDDPAATAPDAANVEAAIRQADRLIDSYAGLHRSAPLDPVPELVRGLSATLAVFFLYRRRGQVPEVWEKQHQADLATLRLIGEGRLTFGPAGGGRENPPQRALTSSTPRAFGGSDGLLEEF